MSNKIIEAQNLWALQNKDAPYRYAKTDLDLWEDKNPKQFNEAKEKTNNDVNSNNGRSWDNHYATWQEFCGDTKNVWPIDKFTKDFNMENRPQRPFDPDHLYKDMISPHDGVFDHSLAGAIDVAVRPDGSNNAWNAWHTLTLAKLCGITHLKVNLLKHPTSWTLEQCRIKETSLYHSKNGLAKKSSTEDLFVKNVIVQKDKGSKKNPDIILSDMFEEMNITPDGSKPTYQKIKGITTLKQSRASLIKYHGNSKTADIKMKEYLGILKERFPKETISGYLFGGLVDFMIKFEDKIEKLDTKRLSDMFESYPLFTQENYIATSDNFKGKNTESISIRIANLFNEFMLKSNITPRRPITLAKAQKAYEEKLPKLHIRQIFDSTKHEFEVQCPHCQEMHNVDIDKVI